MTIYALDRMPVKRYGSQIADISRETSVNGSAVSVANIIKMIDNHAKYDHKSLRDLFSLKRQVLLSDLR